MENVNLLELIKAYRAATPKMREITHNMIRCMADKDATEIECVMAAHTILDALNVRTISQTNKNSVNRGTEK